MYTHNVFVFSKYTVLTSQKGYDSGVFMTHTYTNNSDTVRYWGDIIEL